MADSQRKTANLFDESNFALIQVTSTAYRYGTSLGVLPQGTYTFNATKSTGAQSIYLTAKYNGVYSQTTISSVPFSFTADGASEYIIRTANNTGTTWGAENYSDMMLNTGSTALPYEPYGWVHSLRKFTTATDTITTLPTNIYADGNTATVSLNGNMSQSGTPTPTTPIQPQECGERTENLFDYSTITTGYRIVWGTGALFADDTGILSDFIEVTEGQRYQIASSTNSLTAYILGYDQNKEYLGVYNSVDGFIKAASNRYSTLVIPENSECRYIKLMTYGTSLNGLDNTSMFTAGATAPSEFIPYGFKIPISSASTITNVYLGEVQTTRKIKKLVLDGTESWSLYESSGNRFFYTNIADHVIQLSSMPCTHGFSVAFVTSSSNQLIRIYDRDSLYPSTADFNSYLAAQYATGTPVTVWYVLANSTTGIVNEPLRKIGDYADTVSGVTIPTITGADNFDVQTTLKPSEVSLSYTGWRDASVEEWDGTDWT